jgi:hypothetical protein
LPACRALPFTASIPGVDPILLAVAPTESSPPKPSIAELYGERLRAREARLQRLEREHARMGSLRLVLAGLFVAVAAASGRFVAVAPAWMLLPAAGFAAAVLHHLRVRRRRESARHAVDFYRAGLDRLRGEWRGTGRSGLEFDDPSHVYAADLDLFGPGNLFELLCAARTRMGEEQLARWLLAPAPLGTIRDRRGSIEELRDRLSLREDWATTGDAAPIAVRADRLTGWARAPNRLDRPWIRIGARALPLLAVLTAALWGIFGIASPFLAVVLVEGVVWHALKAPIDAAIAAVESAYEDLKNLGQLIRRIEAEKFGSPRLGVLMGALSSRTGGASASLSRLATLVNLVESRRNPLLGPLMLVVLYPLQTALAAERWRRAHGEAMAGWLTALGEIEALLSLSRYAYEHPEAPFPEFVEGPAIFRASSLGHPLIPAASRVSNDVDISGTARLLLVSGSNMSGKSTLLRAVGVNTVLAMAGAPVCAQRLTLTPLGVGASIRINDSLHQGSSRFYAEITRLKHLLEPAALPTLFLLDELLQGTNSADRRIGAQGVARALVGRGAIGLISTHDLALTEIAGLAPGTLVNVHFQDELRDGRLVFDYRLRPGVVTRSNGVELMRSIGLEV